MDRTRATPDVCRRRILLLAATALSSTLLGRGALAGPPDQGIGGTGVFFAPQTPRDKKDDEEGDRGIGGTGVIGTIRRFGSIVVNDLRIAYAADATVRIDGRPATPGDLKLGQVVRVVATRQGKDYATRAIEVTSEVVGPVERVAGRTLTVAGQTVSAAKRGPWGVGDIVAVSGLRRNDGTIVASLIEARPAGSVILAGPVVQRADGSIRIGGLALSGVDPSLIGRRAVIDGDLRDGRLVVARAIDADQLLPRDVDRVSVEAYVERGASGLRLGSGSSIAGSLNGFPDGASVRAVLLAERDGAGAFTVETLRAGDRRYDASGGNGGAPTGGRQPLDFGHGPPGGGAPGVDRSVDPFDHGPGPGGAGGRGGPMGGQGGGFGGPGGPGGGRR